MNWFWIAMIMPVAHAIANHIDKHLISKYLKGGEVGSLVLFSSLFAIFALPIILIINPNVLSIGSKDALILMANGTLLVLAYICYFYALEKDEASFVVPLFQMVPIFGFILGYTILGETLTNYQIIGSIIIIIGISILSLDLKSIKIGLKKNVFLFMFASSAFYAINGVMFKFITTDQQRFWPSLFWDFSGKVILGILIFLFIKSYREQFINIIKRRKFQVLALNSTNEILGIIGEGSVVFALLLAPIALVQIVGGLQFVFVFIFGLIMTIFLPNLVKESMDKKFLLQKFFGIAIVIAGTIIINIST